MGGGGWGGLKKKKAFGARFQKLRGEPYYQWRLDSKRGREELNSQRGQILEGHHVFLQTSNVVLVGRPIVNVALLSTFRAVQ